jgi:hypothetical protein
MALISTTSTPIQSHTFETIADPLRNQVKPHVKHITVCRKYVLNRKLKDEVFIIPLPKTEYDDKCSLL